MPVASALGHRNRWSPGLQEPANLVKLTTGFGFSEKKAGRVEEDAPFDPLASVRAHTENTLYKEKKVYAMRQYSCRQEEEGGFPCDFKT